MRLRRLIPIAVVAAAILIANAAPATAHVTVNPGEGQRGGFTKLTFRAPNEHDTASTTSVEVNFPTDHVITEARTKPVPGWTATIDKTEAAVTKITWSGGKIAPGEFQEFEVSLRLPEEGDSITFPSIQTYDNGDVVRWIEPRTGGAEEPEHPAPVLTLTAASGEHSGAPEAEAAGNEDGNEDDDGDDSDALPVVALVLALAGIVLSSVSLIRRR